MKIIKLTLFIVTICISIQSCNKSDDTFEVSQTCNLNAPTQEFYASLMNSYNDSCTNCLKDILDEWEKEFSPNTTFPDSLKIVYDVYQEFYSPWNLERMSESEWGNNIYNKYSYYIIQSSINYDFNYESPSTTNFYSISEFRPEIANDTINLLYLTDKHINAFNCFLDVDVENSFFVPTSEKSISKYRFLNNFLFFFKGHWGNYWTFETNPYVQKMSFNNTKDKVKIYFKLGYEGGEAILEKNEEDWEIIDFYMTWIE